MRKPDYKPADEIIGPALPLTEERLAACSEAFCGCSPTQYARACSLLDRIPLEPPLTEYECGKVFEALCSAMARQVCNLLSFTDGYTPEMRSAIEAWLKRNWAGQSALEIREAAAPVWFYLETEDARREAGSARFRAGWGLR